MVREIVFDTETKGFDPETGDKLVEIGAVELINHIPTGVTYHQYINPQREVPDEAFKVHGLSYDYLKQFPTFDKIVDEWIDFVGDATLVAHNASFDIKFINYEQKQLGKIQYSWDRVVDTLEIAKVLFPGSRVNLDALCRRFNIDNTDRTLHGALLDAQLLAQVYLELLGGREPSLLLDKKNNSVAKNNVTEVSSQINNIQRKYREPRIFALADDVENNHREFMSSKLKNPIWLADEIKEEA